MTKLELIKIIKEIATTVKKHDTGERQYKMSDYEYVMKQCEKVLSK